MNQQKRKFEHLVQPGSNPSRFCTQCGGKIKGFTVEKPSICPFANCKARVPLHRGPYQFENGMGRCPNCFAYILEGDVYCSYCKHENPHAAAKKRRLELAEREKAAVARKLEIKKLEEANKQKDGEIAELKRMLAAERKKQEDRLLEEALDGIDMEQESEDDNQNGSAEVV